MLERRRNLGLGLALHRHHEREAEARAINFALSSVKRVSSSALSRSRPALACSCVDFLRQLLRDRELSRQIRMRLDQRALGALAALGHRRGHRAGEPFGAVVGAGQARIIGGFRDPAGVLVDAAEPLDEQGARQLRRLPAARRRMLGDPVPRDVEPSRDPYFVVGRRIIEKPRQRRGASGPPDQPAMQADRQHFGRGRAFSVERVERILQIFEKLVARVEPLRRREPHVVGVERIGHDQLRSARTLHPIGQIVGIGIRAIEEAAFLHAEPQRVDGACGPGRSRAAARRRFRCGCGPLPRYPAPPFRHGVSR